MAAWGNALGGFRRQKRDPLGRFSSVSPKGLDKAARKRGGGVVPYQRHGVGHHTAGVNGGLSITKNRRVSFGAYVRTDSKSGHKLAKKIGNAESVAQNIAATTVGSRSNLKHQDAKVRTIKRIQNKALRKLAGGERRLGDNAYGRVGTDRNGLPTLIVQYNAPKDSKPSSNVRRNNAVAKYNVNSVPVKKVRNSRPQRRNQNAR